MNSRAIPSLDGLRAISIFLVISGHICNANFRPGFMRAVFGNAGLGVNVFFVISGFLITTLLLKEHQKSGDIRLSRFCLRRAFRILPPYYLYLMIVFMISGTALLRISLGEKLSALTFLWNYSPIAKNWALEHIWSLSVEEQFYLLWPALLLFCLKRGGRHVAAKVAIVLIALAPIFRVASHLASGSFLSTHIYFMLHTRMDSLMFGCCIALLSGTQKFEALYHSVAKLSWLAFAFVGIVSPILLLRFGGAYQYIFGYTMEGLCISQLLLWSTRNPLSRSGRLLNSRVMSQIGIMSYSLYLWQTIFLHVENHSVLAHFPLNIIGIVIAASISYFLVEKPWLALRVALVERSPISEELAVAPTLDRQKIAGV